MVVLWRLGRRMRNYGIVDVGWTYLVAGLGVLGPTRMDYPSTMAAVRAVARLPRAKALVLAGSLMGGEIEQAVRDVREQGLLVDFQFFLFRQ